MRHRRSDGHAYFKQKIAERKSPKIALRALKRRISTTLYQLVLHDSQRGTLPPPR
jgi:hypothetical protein